MNDEQQTSGSADTSPVEPEPQSIEAQTLESQPQHSRRRLRELLAIPERDRTDALWDEIIGLEIELAPGNRAQPQQADGGRRQENGRRQDQSRGQQAKNGAQPARRFKKSRRGPGTPKRT